MPPACCSPIPPKPSKNSAAIRRSASRRRSRLSSNPAAAPRNASCCAATTRPASSKAATRNTSRSARSIPISARACSTSPSANAPCSPTKWASAKPSRPSPPAPCSTTSAKPNACLVVTPASLKTEWEEQIRKFTTLTQRLVFGPRSTRAKYYADRDPPFFTIVNYEQIVTDSLDINARLKPDIVVLDEAQRIKNWATKTAQAVKRLESRYAFVLTGTPIENRIDELYSIVDFLDPTLLGPLFRFNREFYQFDESGRPADYQNLAALRERIRPILLRRRKHHVETELPDRTDRNHFVKLTPAMRAEYDDYKQQVSQLVQTVASAAR